MLFPLNIKPLNDVKTTGQWNFGSSRDAGTRKHAGVDLYCPEGTLVYAMETGKIVNSYDEFYLGTGCIEVWGATHVIRYAEIQPMVKAGQLVKEGSVIGKVKRCKGIKNAMLHLEMYTNITDKKALTDRESKPFMRRKDLINPTQIIINLLPNV